MREMKVRAWDKKEKKMIEFEYIDEIILHSDIGGRATGIITSDRKFLSFDDEVELIQFIGLKDKNEKEIFKGDIVKFKILRDEDISDKPTKEVIGEVIFKEGCFCAGKLKHFFYLDREDIEVIGNKFENPELLEEVK